ncbi:vWA domain-containing protein [Ichthyobacterium seriolicida]|uniref:Aerotolerance-related protein BatA n=1 Tax=Ichthyobacterium seriolicida TaxID=242600 RepID=A0A1J1EAG3_9FLAO|nr:VWA domain-containing protein [Ichthyobacterium seriolicida]BAV94923.1 aerotolerance-related protein BatA [Ichthyobacterium seriolicida]
MKDNFEILNTEFLYFLIIIPLLCVWHYFRRKKSHSELQISSIKGFSFYRDIWSRYRWILNALRLLAIVFFIIAMSRPRYVETNNKKRNTMGIDIVMAIDVSGSMLARDFAPNRLDAVKQVASEFVNKRSSDRFGIVAYEAESFTQCPLTTDHKVVNSSIMSIKNGLLEPGTAIGVGLGVAVNRLKESQTKSKVIILLTDGVNNTGYIDPITVTEVAKQENIKIYTIGVGTNGMAETPVGIDPRTNKYVYQMVQVEIDEELLKTIANTTNGKYFRADNNSRLQEIYDEIDNMEKSKLQEYHYYSYQEKFRFWILLGILFLLIEVGLKYSVFKSFI